MRHTYSPAQEEVSACQCAYTGKVLLRHKYVSSGFHTEGRGGGAGIPPPPPSHNFSYPEILN